MRAADLDQSSIHAVEKTGTLVTEDNQHLPCDAGLGEWHAAIEKSETRFRHLPTLKTTQPACRRFAGSHELPGGC
jgi:hypothetical protein